MKLWSGTRTGNSMENNLENMEQNKIVLYQSDDGLVSVDVFFYDETFWLTQKAMAELFGVGTPAISKHLKNIFDEEELTPDATISKMETVQSEGDRQVKRFVDFYNLDAIIAVGYRVNSKSATQFRRWATETLKEYIIKGFVLNDDMLKNGKAFGKDYFDELLERIKEIRASDRRFYQKITDIFAGCSVDYDKKSETTQEFFATVQNKLLYAVTGQTAAELLMNRIDSEKPHLGLTSWKNSPDGKILKSDVSIAKNVLEKDEIGDLQDIVNAYLDFAESRAKRQITMTMREWIVLLEDVLRLNKQEILNNKGTIQAEIAKRFTEAEYGKFRALQDKDYISDFDKSTERFLKK